MIQYKKVLNFYWNLYLIEILLSNGVQFENINN